MPRTIDVAIRALGAQDADAILVLLNHEDGSLVQSWKGSALPVSPTVLNGDIVTYVAAGDGYRGAYSYRVEAGVERVEDTFGAPALCSSDATMHVDVHVPEVLGGLTSEVTGTASASQIAYAVPADLGIDVQSCDGQTADLFVRVNEPAGWAFQYVTVPFVAGTTTSFTAELLSKPRTPLAFDVFGVAGSDGAGGYGCWLHPSFGRLCEPVGALEFPGDAPFHAELNVVDLPMGRPYTEVWVSYPPTDGSCGGGAVIERYGASDVVIPFDAGAIAEPIVDGDTWKLAGVPGDAVRRGYHWGEDIDLYWSLVDDAHVPRAAVFPSFPMDAPDFGFPMGSPKLAYISHEDREGAATYAEIVGNPFPVVETLRTRSTVFDCDL